MRKPRSASGAQTPTNPAPRDLHALQVRAFLKAAQDIHVGAETMADLLDGFEGDLDDDYGDDDDDDDDDELDISALYAQEEVECEPLIRILFYFLFYYYFAVLISNQRAVHVCISSVSDRCLSQHRIRGLSRKLNTCSATSRKKVSSCSLVFFLFLSDDVHPA